MERKLVEVGHRVEAQPGCGLIPDITHTIPGRGGGKIGADAKGRDTVQSSLQRAVVAVGNGIHDRMNEVIAYARREPVGVGLLVGLCLAMGSRATTGAKRDWRFQLNSRRGLLGRRTRSGWRRLLRLE
jgi:hypothetical protein